jgi:hypothetical protein
MPVRKSSILIMKHKMEGHPVSAKKLWDLMQITKPLNLKE